MLSFAESKVGPVDGTHGRCVFSPERGVMQERISNNQLTHVWPDTMFQGSFYWPLLHDSVRAISISGVFRPSNKYIRKSMLQTRSELRIRLIVWRDLPRSRIDLHAGLISLVFNNEQRTFAAARIYCSSTDYHFTASRYHNDGSVCPYLSYLLLVSLSVQQGSICWFCSFNKKKKKRKKKNKQRWR